MSIAEKEHPLSPQHGSRRWVFLLLAALTSSPAVLLRALDFFDVVTIPPEIGAFLYGLSIVGAAFLLSWATEVAELDIPKSLALAFLAVIAVLPEYAVDAVFAYKAGGDPERWAPLAVANMTGANRLLIGVAWPLIFFLFWKASATRMNTWCSFWSSCGGGISLSI